MFKFLTNVFHTSQVAKDSSTVTSNDPLPSLPVSILAQSETQFSSEFSSSPPQVSERKQMQSSSRRNRKKKKKQKKGSSAFPRSMSPVGSDHSSSSDDTMEYQLTFLLPLIEQIRDITSLNSQVQEILSKLVSEKDLSEKSFYALLHNFLVDCKVQDLVYLISDIVVSSWLGIIDACTEKNRDLGCLEDQFQCLPKLSLEVLPGLLRSLERSRLVREPDMLRRPTESKWVQAKPTWKTKGVQTTASPPSSLPPLVPTPPSPPPPPPTLSPRPHSFVRQPGGGLASESEGITPPLLPPLAEPVLALPPSSGPQKEGLKRPRESSPAETMAQAGATTTTTTTTTTATRRRSREEAMPPLLSAADLGQNSSRKHARPPSRPPSPPPPPLPPTARVSWAHASSNGRRWFFSAFRPQSYVRARCLSCSILPQPRVFWKLCVM